MTRYTPTSQCPSCVAENITQPMKSTNKLVEDLEQLTPEMLEEIIRINGCCPRFNNTLPRCPSNTPPDPAEVEKHSIPAFLRE